MKKTAETSPSLEFLAYRNGFIMDGWMTCNLKSFSTVYKSYQDDGQVIKSVQWSLGPVVQN